MTNVIQFLESMGRDASTGNAPDAEYVARINALALDAELTAALLSKDPVALSRLLGGRSNIMMILAPAKEDPQRDEQQDDDDGKEEKQDLRFASAG